MTTVTISSGVVHIVPAEVRKLLLSSVALRNVWEGSTPLARNEWLCWIGSSKKSETRIRRIKIMQEKLLQGDRRPCCWAGCVHRIK
jgi:uncharacterized protein YdeI (YjbR/CyaY-like superfamily)